MNENNEDYGALPLEKAEKRQKGLLWSWIRSHIRNVSLIRGQIENKNLVF